MLACKSLAAVGLASILSVGVLGGSASAETGQQPESREAATTQCITDENGNACLYYNSGLKGAVYWQKGDIANYGWRAFYSYDYKNQPGDGTAVKNNTASVRNRSKAQSFRTYVNSNYAGVSQTIGPAARANLNATLKNNNACGKFI